MQEGSAGFGTLDEAALDPSVPRDGRGASANQQGNLAKRDASIQFLLDDHLFAQRQLLVWWCHGPLLLFAPVWISALYGERVSFCLKLLRGHVTSRLSATVAVALTFSLRQMESCIY